jgi:hypothetical protein
VAWGHAARCPVLAARSPGAATGSTGLALLTAEFIGVRIPATAALRRAAAAARVAVRRTAAAARVAVRGADFGSARGTVLAGRTVLAGGATRTPGCFVAGAAVAPRRDLDGQWERIAAPAAQRSRPRIPMGRVRPAVRGITGPQRRTGGTRTRATRPAHFRRRVEQQPRPGATRPSKFTPRMEQQPRPRATSATQLRRGLERHA